MIEPPVDNPPDDDGEIIWCGACKWYKGNEVAGLCHGPLAVSVLTGVNTAADGSKTAIVRSFYGGPLTPFDYCWGFKRWPNRPPLDGARLVQPDHISAEPPPLFLPEMKTEGTA